MWVEEAMLELESIGVHWDNKHAVDMTSYKDKRFFNAIWHVSDRNTTCLRSASSY